MQCGSVSSQSFLRKTGRVLTIVDQFTRSTIGLGVLPGDRDAALFWRMFNKDISTIGIPKHLSSDHVPLFAYHQCLVNIRRLDVDETKSIPRMPDSHPLMERLIATIRCQFWAILHSGMLLTWRIACLLIPKSVTVIMAFSTHCMLKNRPKSPVALPSC